MQANGVAITTYLHVVRLVHAAGAVALSSVSRVVTSPEMFVLFAVMMMVDNRCGALTCSCKRGEALWASGSQAAGRGAAQSWSQRRCPPRHLCTYEG